MAFYFSKRKLRPKEDEETGELNIVPYLDILMNLIIFMLLSMTGLAAFGILNVNAPNYGGGAAAVQENQEGPKLLLSVLISKKGFTVAGTGAVLPGPQAPEGQAPEAGQGEPTIPKLASGEYDFPALTAQMVNIKKEFPNETKVVVAADGDIPYETLVQTMDAIRETTGKGRKILFADVTLAAM